MFRTLFFFWQMVLPCCLLAQKATAQPASSLPDFQVSISPVHPVRGDRVTITFRPQKTDQPQSGQREETSASRSAAVTPPQLVFTYSNLYELPTKINLQRSDSGWYTSFVLPRYATFATFYIQVGEQKITPAGGGHYELAVYEKGPTGLTLPIKNGLLYKAYSLSAQKGKSGHLADDQAELYRFELTMHPDNYEAMVRLYQDRISRAAPGDKEKIRQNAEAFIADKFESDPTSMGNLNYVTMGYLILGENSRLDSIRKVVVGRYPHLPIAKELMMDQIRKEKDTAVMIARLEKELRDELPGQQEGYSSMHEILFEYYSAHGDSARALLHARGMLPEKSPYLPEVLLHITHTLARYQLAPDTALAYGRRALQLADSFPAGIIRYFPETGYIPSYVPDSVRSSVIRQARGNSLALISWIYADRSRTQPWSPTLPGSPAQQTSRTLALLTADSAIAVFTNGTPDGKTWQYLAAAFEKLDLPEKAYHACYQWALEAGTKDTAWMTTLKKNYRLWKGDRNGWQKEQETLIAAKRIKLINSLQLQQLRTQAPSLDNIVDLAGKAVSPKSLTGKVIVIDFWATWCIPCMEEMPYLQKVYDVYKNNPKVAFLVINSGARNTLQDAQNWFGNKKYSFPVYFHTNPSVGEVFGFNTIPAVFVIGPDGHLQFRTIGFEGPDMEEKLGAEIEMLLTSPPTHPPAVSSSR